jgi:DnaJ domain
MVGASTDDPFAVLGLAAGADAEAIRAARRRLAMELHPDRGGDAERMQAINVAYEQAMAQVGAPSEVKVPAAASGPDVDDRQPSGRRRLERDEPSFVIEALPAEAFEALLVVASWIGEVLVDDPPYLLEAHLDEPSECWCRLELLPEAGATTVMLAVAGIEGIAPPVEAVRDLWVTNLNLLGAADS